MEMDKIGAEFLAALIAFVGSAATYFLQKRSERRSVNIAVLAEVQRLLGVLKSHASFREKCAAEGRDVPLIPFSTDVFQSQVAQVGIIHGSIVADVVRFYGYIDFLNSLQGLKAEYESKGDLAGFNATYDRTLNTVTTTFPAAFERAFMSYGLK